MFELEQFYTSADAAGCPPDQSVNFFCAGIFLQPRQLAASAAARLCDSATGPDSIAFGGARGGGKSYWLLAQMGADDCQRYPGLKCLLLRKVGKSNLEHFEDLRRRVYARLKHEFAPSRGLLTFANGSRIVAGHYQNESDIDAYLGLEYDVIGIEEATTLTHRKYLDISTCCRTSKSGWRPRIYSTANPGGVGHAWYRARFVQPFQAGKETDTRFIPARVSDNQWNNPDYRKVLEKLSGWQRRAWLEGDWDIAAGQFFAPFRHDIHVIKTFDPARAVQWFAALDYGFNHYTVVLLGCKDGDGNIYVIDEHAQRLWLPQRHAEAIKAMLAHHQLYLRGATNSSTQDSPREPIIPPEIPESCKHPAALRYDVRRLKSGRLLVTRYMPEDVDAAMASVPPPPAVMPPLLNYPCQLSHFFAGTDVFSSQSDGSTVASQYARLGIRLTPANTDRVNGWAEILRRLGDPDHGIAPTLFIHQRCTRLLECLPALQHDPARPEDILKTDIDENGQGGDDAADTLRYLVNSKPNTIVMKKLRGL